MFELEPNLLSKSIFNKNQKENENLAIYFWLNEDKREILDPSLVRACAEAEAGIRYNHIQHCYDMYLKRNEGTSELQKLLGPTIRDQQLLLIVLIVRIRTIIIAAISDNVSIGIPAIIVDFCTLY